MNSLFAVIVTTIFFIGTGWFVTYLLPTLGKIERIGMSFLLGSGLTTFLWFLGYLVGLPFNLFTLILAGLLVVIIGYQLAKVLKLKPLKYEKLKLSKAQSYLAVIIIVALLSAFLIGSYNPLTAWDSIALYDFRGHTIAINHSLKDLTDSSYYVSYPLMISLVHSVIYMLGGINAQGIHAIIFMSFIAVVYGRMKDWTNTTYALITCLLIIGQNEIFEHATYAYTNLPYLAFLVTGIIYAVSATTKNKYFLPIAGLLIGLSTWVRSTETFWVIGLILILWQSWNTKQKWLGLLSAILLIGIRFTWTNYFNHILVSINYSYDETIRSFGIKNIQRIISNWPEIYWYMRLNIFSPYLGIWFLIIPTTLTYLVKRNLKLLLLVGTILLSSSMLIVGIAVFSTFYNTWSQIGDSARRMILFMVPLSIITTTYAIYTISQKAEHE